jgi:hypothetical protein
VLERAAEPIELPDEDRITSSRVRSREHAVEFRPRFPGTGNADVDELAGDFPTAAGSILTQLRELHFRILIVKG